MNDYTKGILTGASLILCFFMFVSAKSQSKSLGHITVDSVAVVNENGQPVGLFGSAEDSGFLALNRAGIEHPFVGLVCEKDGGEIFTYNADGKRTAYLKDHLETFNKHGERTGYFGTGKNNDGLALLYDRYGDAGWAASGEK